MTQQEALRKQATNIENDFRHKYYDDNVELYEKYLTLSTGRGWEKFLHRLTSRVSQKDFEEIINVTIDLCKSVVKNLCHVFYRVTRSIGIKIEWTVEDSGKKEDFANILSTFGRYGFDGYREKRFTDFCKIDPNGFVVVEFKPTDGKEYARPYPVEFYSPDVLDYDYELNQLQYLSVKQDTIKPQGKINVEVSDYTIYTNEGAVKFIARPDLEFATPYDPAKEYSTGDLIGLKERIVQDDKGKERTIYDVYELLIPEPYNLEWVPAICSGYLTDEYHRGDTFLNFFDNAVPLLEKIIKTNSESDISASKHAFAQKIQFVSPCPNHCERNNEGIFCIDNIVCPICNGDGNIESHRTGMDCITIPLTPENVEMIDLNNIITYVRVDLETIKYLWAHIVDDLVAFAKRVMYNTEIFNKQEISDTATAKLIEMENMYDTLFLYAVHYVNVSEFLLKTIAAITEIKIKINASVSKDFKLLGKAQLLEMLQLATNAGANAAVIEAINDELAYAFFGNSPAYKNYLERKKLIPFQNKSKEQVMLILNDLPPTHTFRLMFEFGEEIIGMLETTYPDWSEFTIERKQQLIKAELDRIESEMVAEKPETPVFGKEPAPVE